MWRKDSDLYGHVSDTKSLVLVICGEFTSYESCKDLVKQKWWCDFWTDDIYSDSRSKHAFMFYQIFKSKETVTMAMIKNCAKY